MDQAAPHGPAGLCGKMRSGDNLDTHRPRRKRLLEPMRVKWNETNFSMWNAYSVRKRSPVILWRPAGHEIVVVWVSLSERARWSDLTRPAGRGIVYTVNACAAVRDRLSLQSLL